MIEGVGKGRYKIFDDREINENTIIQIIFDAMNTHRRNIRAMTYLIEYYKGQQDILNRNAPSTSEINNKVVFNYANSSVRDIVGYTFGKPIQIIPRKAKYRKDIKNLSDILEYENVSTIDNEVATYSSICGISYFCTLPSKELTSDFMPDVPIKIHRLNVLNTFAVYSSEIGNPLRLTCTYWSDKKYTYFTVFTDEEIYYIVSEGQNTLSGTKNTVQKDVNLIGLNPIQVVENNEFRMGDFEIAISVLNALNQIGSDSVNDVENVLKSLLVIINSELETGEDGNIAKARTGRVLELIGTQGAANVDAKFIYQQLDSMGIKELREYLEEAYKIIIGIPDRKTRGGGGGDTGDAVKLRDGWADIEIVARIKENYFKIAKKKQIAVVIKILQMLGLAKEDFKTIDLDVKFTRNKNDNLQTKAQAYSTLHGTRTLDPADAMEICDMTTDVVEMMDRGKKYWDEVAQKNIEAQMQGTAGVITSQTNKYDTKIQQNKNTTQFSNNDNPISPRRNSENKEMYPEKQN